MYACTVGVLWVFCRRGGRTHASVQSAWEGEIEIEAWKRRCEIKYTAPAIRLRG